MYKYKRVQRHKKIRKIIFGQSKQPRLAVFRSTQHIYAQIIDDTQGKTLVASSDLEFKKGSKMEKASLVGEDLAKRALTKKIKQVVFDRGGFKYHGRVAALANGARKGGLQF